MQEYLKRSRLGGLADQIGLHLLMLFFSLLWFILQWGLCLPALTAGLALFLLLTFIVRKAQDGRLIRRERQLRIRIGGEMALERLLTADAARAHFEIALLLSMRHPLTMIKSCPEGVLCTLRGEYLLISFCQCPLSAQINAEHVLQLQQQARKLHAARGVLCAPCPISPSARDQALGEIGITFYTRDQLIPLLGEINPATDAQLIALGKRKRKKATLRQWRDHILDPRRTPRYTLYGALLLALYLITKLPHYILPGLCCLGLAAACRCRKEKKESL